MKFAVIWFFVFFAVVSALGFGELIYKLRGRDRLLSARSATCTTATLGNDVLLRGRARTPQPAISPFGDPCLYSELEIVHLHDNFDGHPTSSAQVIRRWAPEWVLVDGSGELKVTPTDAILEGLKEHPSDSPLTAERLGDETDAIRSASRTTVRTLAPDSDVLVVGRLVIDRDNQRTLRASFISGMPNAISATRRRLIFDIWLMSVMAAASVCGLWLCF